MTAPLPMTVARSLAAGLAGALTLNALSEAAHRAAPPGLAAQAPRLDRLGTAVLARALGLHADPEAQADRGGAVYAAALALDVALNTVGYAVTSRSGRPVRSAVLGALGGAATVAGAFLLGRVADVARRPATPALTVLWYAAGGAAAGLAARALNGT